MDDGSKNMKKTNNNSDITKSMELKIKTTKSTTNNSRVIKPRRYNPNNINMPELGMKANNVDEKPRDLVKNESNPIENKNNFQKEEYNPILNNNNLDNNIIESPENIDETLDNINEYDNESNIQMPYQQNINNEENNATRNESIRPENDRFNRNSQNNVRDNKPNNYFNRDKKNNDNLNNNQKTPNNLNKVNTPSKNAGKQTNTPSNKGTSSNTLSKIASMNQMKNSMNQKIEEGESETEAAKQVAQEEAKKVVKEKVKQKLLELFIEYILPILPYILIALLVFLVLIILIFTIMAYVSDEENVVLTMELNYCENVNIKWGDGDTDNVTIPANDYIRYQIATSDYKTIDDKEAIKALVVVLRTNLYANSDNMDSNVCYIEVEEPYDETAGEDIKEYIEETKNKVFSLSDTELSEIEMDDKFTYKEIKDSSYKLYQDGMSYDKDWIDSKIDSSNITNDAEDKSKFSYPPFAAWYFAAKRNYQYHSLIYHYVSPTSDTGNLYNAVKIGGFDGSNGMCSDISLTSTTLSREEFISLVQANVSSQIFKDNAGKIYDISIQNHFNPEMVVIKAYLEGNYTTQGGANNYWGLGCPNGAKVCSGYSTFDEGVLAFINNIKSHNYSTLYEMQYKYSYIGKYWFNPGGSGLGGCYYYPYLKKYLSEERANVVGEACVSGKSCKNGGIGDCLATIDEDQAAYTKYNIEKSLNAREKIFGIGAEDCEEGADIEDDGSLGAKAAKYAVTTFDSWSYSQTRREQQGFVDCSSLVARAYEAVGFNAFRPNGYSFTSSAELNWCRNNNRLISESQLRPGDLLLREGHVEMYIGNGRRFGAHTGKAPQPDQVSIKPYVPGSFKYLCHVG